MTLLQKAVAARNRVLARHQLEPAFPQSVLNEVEALQADPGIDEPSLDDLTDVPFITIDYEESRDLDQAMCIETEPNAAGFLVSYALADATHYVRPGTAMYTEALRRGVSYYLPSLTVPMLPPELSEGIVSLNPGVDRRAVVFVIRLDALGRVVDTRMKRARIRSRAKLTYDGVQAYLDAPEQSPYLSEPFLQTLNLLKTVGELRLAEARERNVVHFDRIEVEVGLSADGQQFCIQRDIRNDVSRYNEQISLLCNIQGAQLLVDRTGAEPHVQPVFRIHEPPRPESLDRLEHVILALVKAHNLDPAVYTWRPRGKQKESISDYLDRLRTTDGVERRIFAAIEQQVLITNQRSTYSSEPGQHFALGVQPYSRFSAPMREIVGIFTHKEALEKLGFIEPLATPLEDEQLRERVINSANRAKERQRRIAKDVMRLAIDGLLKNDLNRPFAERTVHRGTILGVRPSRLYVRLDVPPIDLKIYTQNLERSVGYPYEMSSSEVEMRPKNGKPGPRFRLGDAIAITNDGMDNRGRWRLVPINTQGA